MATLDAALLHQGPDGGGPAVPSALRVLLAASVCWCLFVNHYARDVTGALEREMEADLGISPSEYQALNSAYFGPNIIVPLVIGALAQTVGATRMLMATQLLAAIGHVVVASGAQWQSYSALLVGRFVLGLTYESIDILPLPILAPRFRDTWGMLVGLFNGALRMGSVTNFALSPVAYRLGGVSAAMWLSCSLGLSGLAAAIVVQAVERRMGKPEVSDGPAAEAEEGSARGDGASPRRRQGCGSGPLFGLYVLVGSLMYSAIVPFWFSGGAFIRDKWGYSLPAADALMLFPEGGMVVLSPPVGIAVDRLASSVRTRALLLTASMLAVTCGFGILVAVPAGTLPPLVPLGVLGVAWAASNTLFWSLSSRLVPARCYALGAGILGSGMNIGPTALPVLMAKASSEAAGLSWLGGAAALACLGALLLHLVGPRR